MNSLRFFVDFDGTITKNDVVDMILERFASDKWREIEKEWAAGRIGSRECLSKQLALVSVSQDEFIKFLKTIEIDPHFVSFLRKAKALSTPVAIVSDGFRIVIEEVLKRNFKDSPELVRGLSIFSNDLSWASGEMRMVSPKAPACEHGCANCKERVVKNLNSKNGDGEVIFVGDGLSDRFAAGVSDLTFAKGKLLKFCEDNKIPHKSYTSFREIENWLVDSFAGNGAASRFMSTAGKD